MEYLTPDWNGAPVYGPLLAEYVGVEVQPPTVFQEDSVTADAVYLTLFNRAIEKARQTGQPCPIFLHPKLMGKEGQQVELELPNGVVQVWVSRTKGVFPKHTIRVRKNGIDPVIVSPDAPIRSVQVISEFARQRRTT